MPTAKGADRERGCFRVEAADSLRSGAGVGDDEAVLALLQYKLAQKEKSGGNI